MTFVYILKLEENKYYVGKADCVERRFQEHIGNEGHGSKWTSKYKPLCIMEVKEGADEEFETLRMMKLYGM